MNTFTCLLILQSLVAGQTTTESESKDPVTEDYEFAIYKSASPYLLRISWNETLHAEELRVVGINGTNQQVLVHLKNNVPFKENDMSVSYFMLPPGYSRYRLELPATPRNETKPAVRGIDAVERPSLRKVVENFRDPVDFARLVRTVQENSKRITYSGVPQKFYEGTVEDVILKNKHGHCSHFCYLLQEELARNGYEAKAYGMSMAYANHAVSQVELPATRVFTPTSLCVDGNLGIVYFRSVEDIFVKPQLADEFLVGGTVKRRFWRIHGSQFFAMKTRDLDILSREEMRANLRIIIERTRERELAPAP